MYNNQRSKQILERDYTIGNHQSGSNRYTPVKRGLVGEWLLNGDATDSLGINNGTSTNVTWVDSGVGYTKQAGSFGGTAYISFGSGLYDNIKTINNYAFSFRIKLNSLTGGGVIYSTQLNTDFYLYFDANGRSRLRRGTNFSDGANGDFTTGAWYHYVVNYTGATTADLYRNGVKLVSNYSISATSNTTHSFVLGAYYNFSLKINGTVELFRVHKQDLTYKEIQTLYKEGLKLLH